MFVLLFTTVLCRPARKVSDSSSESSEEVVRRPAAALRKQATLFPQSHLSSVQQISASTSSDDSIKGSDEEAGPEAPVEIKSDSVSASLSTSEGTDSSVSATASSSTTSEDRNDSNEDNEDDGDDDDDDKDNREDSETEEEDSNSSESSENSTASTATVSPVIVIEDNTPAIVTEETASDPIEPTIVTDNSADTGRGDSLGSYPSEYKSIVYVEDKSYHKMPDAHKSWDYSNKKSIKAPTDGNEVHKTFKVYKALQVNQELLEDDTSTPEVDTQGLDNSLGSSQDLSPRQASLPEEDSTGTSDNMSDGSSDSSGTTEEEEGRQAKAEGTEESVSTSVSEESEDEESQSSEEATATPGAADSNSDESDSGESDSNEDALQLDIATDMPVVVTAK